MRPALLALFGSLLLGCGGTSADAGLPLPERSVFTGVELAWPAQALVLRAARAEAVEPSHGVATEVVATVAGEGSEGGPTLEIRSERASWDLQQQSVVFEGAVEAVRGAFTLSCERLDARFDSPERLVAAEATGAVRVVHEGRVATGQRAMLDVPSARIELTGEPRVQEGGRTLAGERIVLFLDETRLECERCTLAVVPASATP